MAHWRRRNWQNDIPREFSAIYKLVLDTAIRFAAFALPAKFTDARDARNFAERWNPDPSFPGTITPLSVCETKFVEDKLKIYREQPAAPPIGTLAGSERL